MNDNPQQYLTTYSCDGTEAYHYKRRPTMPRVTFHWEPATADEVAAAAFKCGYCGALYDDDVQCVEHPECAASGVAAPFERTV
jgi:hypothetical protein